MKHVKRIRWTTLAILVLYMIHGGVPVYADTRTQTDMYLQGVTFYDINDPGDCTTAVGDPTLVGSDSVEQAYNYFVQQGLSPAAAAGIIGNLMEESSLDPTRLQGEFSKEYPSASLSEAQVDDSSLGWGIAQWTAPSSIITVSLKKGISNKQIDTLAYQVQFLLKEMEGNPTYFELPQLKAATSPKQAADIFEAGFERANPAQAALSTREKNAQDVYNKYSGNGTTSSGVAAPATADGGCATSGGTGQNTQYAGNFPFYSQCDPTWANDSFGDTTICADGCGPTSMAMIISALTGQAVTPPQTAAYATSINDYEAGVGTKWSIGPDEAKHWNLNAKSVSSVAGITAALQSGGLVIVAGTGGLPFTGAGHFIVIRAVAADGKWLLGDPDTSPGHSNTAEWSPQAVVAAGLEWGSAYVITK